MWKIIIRLIESIIFEKLETSDAGKLFLKYYYKYKEAQQSIGKIKSIYSTILDPQKWLKLLLSIPKTEWIQVEKVINKAEHYTETRSYYKQDAQAFNEHLDELRKEMNGQSDWIKLSSSWLTEGKWEISQKNKVLGFLSLRMNTSEKTYIYPVVPYQVWVAMKNAKGKNGSGAGSAFWKWWLRDWLPSAIREKVLKDIRLKKISPTDAYSAFYGSISRSSRNFFRASNSKINSYGTLNKDWYNTRGGKAYRSTIYQNYKNYYKFNTRIIKYKNVNKVRRYTETIMINKQQKTEYGQFVSDYRKAKRQMNLKNQFKKSIKKGIKNNGKK